jgi:hypothetical protein
MGQTEASATAATCASHGQLRVHVSAHAGYLGRVGMLGRFLPQPPCLLVAEPVRFQRVVDHRGHGRGLAGLHELLGVGGEVGIDCDS